ncbi:MAG: response regulator [Bryobacteraceae bacterium]|nr:response regulator [Bryobacteraceae bacterium]
MDVILGRVSVMQEGRMSPRVLVIDDEEAARYGMVKALSGEGYELQDTGDSGAALALIDEFQPDVVLSDINMPDIDGLTLLREVRRREDPPLVVLITGYGSEKVAAEALRAGAYNYIPKPYELNELRNAIRNAVDRQRLAAKLKSSQAALAHANKMAALAELVAGVAHEINNPLGVVQSSTQTIETGVCRLRASMTRAEAPDPQCLRLLEVVETSARQSVEACRRISRTVSNMAAFAQLDRADFQEFQLNESVECTAALVRPRLGDGIKLELRLGPLPPIEGNPRDVNQVVLHLVRNAADAIRRGPGQGEIAIDTAAGNDEVIMKVADNGVGIPEENLASVFDPGFTTKGVGIGIGAGLAICHQIVHAHHGRITVTSKPGDGATFEVSLPVRQPG